MPSSKKICQITNPMSSSGDGQRKQKRGFKAFKERMDFVFSDGIPIKNNFLKDLFYRKMHTFFN